MVNTVTTNLARGSQERHLSTHSASHLERQQPAGFEFCQTQYLTRQCLEKSSYSTSECLAFQFRPVPVLADSCLQACGTSGEARESTLESRRVRRNSVSLIIKRTLAAGRIQFMSAWRNVKTQCDTNATRDDGRSWLLLNHEWNDRPVARLQAGQCFNAQRSNSPRMVGGLAVIPHHLTVSCRFKSCRAHQFYRATLPFWPDQSRAVYGGTRSAITGQTQQPMRFKSR